MLESSDFDLLPPTFEVLVQHESAAGAIFPQVLETPGYLLSPVTDHFPKK